MYQPDQLLDEFLQPKKILTKQMEKITFIILPKCFQKYQERCTLF